MKATLKDIRLQNFKSHKDFSFRFNNKTEIYGANAVGKSSVGEAIRFALFPSKKDKDKISVGEDKAVVYLNMEVMNDSGKPVALNIKSSITSAGMNSRSVKFDGIAPQNPASFLKELVSYGTFNPKELIESDDREKRLLNLFPAKVTREDFKEFNLHNPDNIDWNQHAFQVLHNVEKDLRNTKLNLYQEADLKNKYYKNADANLNEKKMKYQDNFKEDVVCFKDIITKKARLEKEIEDNAIKQNSLDSKIKSDLIRKDEIESDIKSLTEEIREKEKSLIELKCQLKEFNLEATKKELDKLKEINSQRYVEKESLKSKILQSEQKTEIEKETKDLEEFKKDADKSKKLHDAHYEKNIKTLLPKMRQKILKPLKDKIDGFDIVNGRITLNGKSVDELSESETLALGIKIIGLENKSSFIVVDCAECMTKDTIGKQNWPDNVLLIRVADAPIGIDDWKSIKIL